MQSQGSFVNPKRKGYLPLKKEHKECLICCSCLQKDLFSLNQCSHLYCWQCLSQHVEHQTNSMLVPVCPKQDCGVTISPQSPFFFRMPPSLQKKTQKVLNYRKVLHDSTLKPCLSPDCAGVMDTNMGLICSQCGKEHCGVCFGIKHAGECEARVAVGLEMRWKWRQCLVCRQVIQKISGCTFVKCRCGNFFCYTCGETIFLISPKHVCLPPKEMTVLQAVRWEVEHLGLYYQTGSCNYLKLLLYCSPPHEIGVGLLVAWVALFTLILYPILVVMEVLFFVVYISVLTGTLFIYSFLIPFQALSDRPRLFPNEWIGDNWGYFVGCLLVLLFYPLFYLVNLVQYIYKVLKGSQYLPLVKGAFVQLLDGLKYVVLMPCLMLVSNEQFHFKNVILRVKN